MSEEPLQIAEKRREAKSKGEKERYKHPNAEFQRIARRDKKTFLSDQCKEMEENNRMISVLLQGQTFNMTVIQVYAPTSNTEEAEVEQFYEDLQDLLELTAKKDVLFIMGDWNAKAGNQETPGVTGKLDLGVRNEAGQRLIEFCQENALVIANTLFQQHKRRLYTWTSPDGQQQNHIDYILFSQK